MFKIVGGHAAKREIERPERLQGGKIAPASGIFLADGGIEVKYGTPPQDVEPFGDSVPLLRPLACH